jgi:hypothetical protein
MVDLMSREKGAAREGGLVVLKGIIFNYPSPHSNTILYFSFLL